jgi:arylsulfatase A-like enzyme
MTRITAEANVREWLAAARRIAWLGMTRLWLIAHVLAGGPAAEAAAPGRPNVIVIMTDDQGYGDFTCHGNPVLETPHLDRLAAESLRFTNFHATPMCTPTRGQLLTGNDALRNGAMNVSSGRTLLRRGIPTIANLFADAGYQCGQFGKWHLGDNYPFRPQDRGFHEALYYPSSHIGSAADTWNNDYFDDTYWHNGRREKFEGYTTDVFFREAMRWMGEQAAAGQPFFCYLATAAAHGPLFVPDKYREPYRAQQRNVASFFGMIANIDENIGRMDAFLQERNLRSNTLVVFLTDNGGTAGVSVHNAGMRGRKIELYEGGHRVPCFLRWPAGKLRPPGDVAKLTQVQDLVPTLVELCGISLPQTARFDGLSLAGLLRGEEDHLPDRKLVIQFSRMNAPVPRKGDACVLWKQWRLIGNEELYDVASDPNQQHNVADQHPGVVGELRRHYNQWWEGVAPEVNRFSRLVVGSGAETHTLLSPCEWADVFLDQMAQVRRGERKNGVWHLEVDRDGQYEFELRRWPAEADLPIPAASPAHRGVDGVYPAGVALPIAKARIKVADFDQTVAVAADDRAVSFPVTLARGPVELQTWFYDEGGKELSGAYFVYVQRQ